MSQLRRLGRPARSRDCALILDNSSGGPRRVRRGLGEQMRPSASFVALPPAHLSVSAKRFYTSRCGHGPVPHCTSAQHKPIIEWRTHLGRKRDIDHVARQLTRSAEHAAHQPAPPVLAATSISRVVPSLTNRGRLRSKTTSCGPRPATALARHPFDADLARQPCGSRPRSAKMVSKGTFAS